MASARPCNIEVCKWQTYNTTIKKEGKNMGKSFTISCSMGHHSEEHSRRSYVPFSGEISLSCRNIVIYDCGNDRGHLNEIAEPFIRAYNEKQKRNDRKKDYEKDYVSALENGTACYGKGEQQEKPFHHDVIQIGNRDSLGITNDKFDVDYWRWLKKESRYGEAAAYVKVNLNYDPDVKIATQILKEVAEEILENRDNRYSNILVHGLIIHCDEPNGTPHLDFRYSIFTDDEKRGVPWRISDHKGLQKMGFETTSAQTALQAFRESINARIEEKMRQYGWKREYKNEHRKHLSTAQYEAEQRLKAAEEMAEDILQNAKISASEISEKIEMEYARVSVAKQQYQQKKMELIERMSREEGIQNEVKEFMCSEVGKTAYMDYLEASDLEEDVFVEKTDETVVVNSERNSMVDNMYTEKKRKMKRNGKIEVSRGMVGSKELQDESCGKRKRKISSFENKQEDIQEKIKSKNDMGGMDYETRIL